MRTCRKCGGMSIVKDIRAQDGTVYRRRECRCCGEVWKTYEVSETDYKSLRAAKARRRNAKI